jgi:predicted metalloprotease
VPDANLPVVNDGHTEFDRIMKNAIADVEAFWRKTYPSVSNGRAFPRLKGHIYSVDGAKVTPAVKRNACIKQDPSSVVDNAFYCLADDSIAYDRNPTHLVAQLAAKYGEFMIAAVIAHEFGHAIQQRLGIFHMSPSPPTIATETQADCAAGSFIAAVQQQQAPHFHLSGVGLDRTLLGYLQVRDPPPVSLSQISHGNGFDRLSAMSDGISKGAGTCYARGFFDRRFTERPFTSDADYLQHGNLPFQQIVDPQAPGGGVLAAGLNAFWKRAATRAGKPWTDVAALQAPHPACQPSGPSEFNYCGSDNKVYFSDPFARSAYFSLPDKRIDKTTGAVTLIDNAPADYALGTLFVYGWGMAVRKELFNASTDDHAAVLAAGCYSGAFTAALNSSTPPSTFQLSPPDMDEATAAVIKLVPLDRAYGSHGTSALERIQAFTKGYFGGLDGC